MDVRAEFDRRGYNIIAVVGPTASGKTALGTALAQRLDGEVVSCDSMQVYRGMDIASAKPTAGERAAVPHHLIDYVNQDEPYSVARFCEDANAAIADIEARSKLPVLVGGTGLYVNSLLDGINFVGAAGDDELRKKLLARAETEGGEALLNELASFDPETAARLHKNDIKRITRALEMSLSGGADMSEQIRLSKQGGTRFKPLMIGINFADRDRLYERINRRVDMMLEAGLADEARLTFEKAGGLPTAAQAIGHKELFPYFAGEKSLEECIEHLKMQTRRYAKRQLSWFRRDERINWIYADRVDDVAAEAERIIRGE